MNKTSTSRSFSRSLLAVFVMGCVASAARSQEGPAAATSPLLGGVPSGQASSEVLQLSVADAVSRGLQYNLAIVLREEAVHAADGGRLRTLADLLPDLRGGISESRQKNNLEAFGLSLPGVPSLVGPFDVFDARLRLRQPLFDLSALSRARAQQEALSGERYQLADTHELVVVVCSGLYFQALAAQARIQASRALLDTARALHDLALDRKQAGTAAAIDVLRAEVEKASREQQLIVAQNAFARAKLTLARAIGVPLDQEMDLTDRMSFTAAPTVSIEDALHAASQKRCDLKAAEARVRSAEQARDAISRERLPAVDLRADYGIIGPSMGDTELTYAAAAELRLPIFQSGRLRGRLREADARLDAEKASLEDLHARISYEVRVALLDVQASADRVRVAEQTLALARQQLAQAEDRFRAGVASNIEVVEAQQSLAAATEREIASLYDHIIAKSSLARSMGTAEEVFRASSEGAR